MFATSAQACRLLSHADGSLQSRYVSAGLQLIAYYLQREASLFWESASVVKAMQKKKKKKVCFSNTSISRNGRKLPKQGVYTAAALC